MSSHGVARSTRPRTEEQRRKEVERIQKYRTLEEQFRTQVDEGRYDAEMLALTSKLLRTNPEYYTVWNARRRCLVGGPLSRPNHVIKRRDEEPRSSQSTGDASQTAQMPPPASSDKPTAPGADVSQPGVTAEPNKVEAELLSLVLDTTRSELAFTIPLLMEFPKCYWIWNYRLWILVQAQTLLPTEAARDVWQEELGLVGKMLHRDQRNFHAWTYRRLVIAELESASLHGNSMVENEFAYTTTMIHANLSNFSAWHNRSQLIPRLLNERNADSDSRRELLNEELVHIREAINVDPEDQSLWYYHQYLILNVCDQTRHQRSIVPDMSLNERQTCLAGEISEVKELLEDYTSTKWIYEALLDYHLAARQLGCSAPQCGEPSEVVSWLQNLRELDPKRTGRWNDLEKEIA
jgi:geranylgeranyl transferase type-2 subunit alpha